MENVLPVWTVSIVSVCVDSEHRVDSEHCVSVDSEHCVSVWIVSTMWTVSIVSVWTVSIVSVCGQ